MNIMHEVYCEECGLRVPLEYIEPCARCHKDICPVCDEDGHACAEQQPVALPLAA